VTLLYTPFKIFHYQAKLNSLPASNKEILAPVHIRIKPTNACNHNCNYCAYRNDSLQLGQNMSVKDYIPEKKMMEIIHDIIDMKVQAVTFSGGGEPFFYKHLLPVVKLLSKSDVKFASLTNGALLNGELAEIFAHNASWLRVSMDGWDGDSYARYRGVKKDAFSKLLNNLENFNKLNGNCLIGVSVIIDKENASHIYELINKLKNVGVKSVKVSPCVVSNKGIENNHYHKPIFDQVRVEVDKALSDLSEQEFEIFDAYHELDSKFEKDYNWCPFLQVLPVIGADLNIYPCQDKAYNLDTGVIGSIKNTSFKEFWFSDKNKFFKIDPSQHCNHHCVANSKNKNILEYLNADKDHLCFV